MTQNSKNKIKICFASSSGGHYEQLMMLKPLMKKYDSFIVTEKTNYSINSDIKIYLISQVNRKEFLFLPRIVLNSIISALILLKERPHAVICTGVLAVIPLCFMMKLSGKKLIYIESFAKVTSATLSGKLLYHFADRFYVQWEEMLDIFPDATYKGGIY